MKPQSNRQTKGFTFILILTLLLGLCAASAHGEGGEPVTDASGRWKYTVVSGGAVIAGCVGEPEGDVVLPGQLDGYTVVGIGDSAFYEYFAIPFITITIPSSVISIGNEAFYACTGITDIVIPDSVISIGNGAFYSCSGIRDMVIPDGVMRIGDSAFFNCTLTSITIPGSVTGIGYNPFSGNSITFINVAESNPRYTQIDGVLFDMGEKALIAYPSGKEGAYIIPDGIAHISDGAFSYNGSLESITIPGSVISIGAQAFYGCDILTNVTIPYGVTSIGDGAFAWCRDLTSITIPSSVTSIGEEVFYKPISLKSAKSNDEKAFYQSGETLRLRVAQGSYAEGYAKENNIACEFIVDCF